ncbi:MAG: arylsulfatase [Gemmataceae bacterium]|nr:arylsulfatase [Gemmataceae bacterium]
MARMLLAVVAFSLGAAVHADEKRPPNIVFVLADDLGYGDVGCYGQKRIKTPNLDRLAAEGMRLTQHYSGSPVCAPSRCVLLTGKHPGHAIIRNNKEIKPEGQQALPSSETTLSKILKMLGYATGGFGKWGLGGPASDGIPAKHGFDRFYGYLCQAVAHNYYPIHLWDNNKKILLENGYMKLPDKLPEKADPKDPDVYKGYVGKQYSGDLIFDQARDFMRQNKDRPFFLYVPTTIPHVSLQVPDDSLKPYLGRWEDPPYIGGKGYLPHRTPRAAYAAMISRLDQEVGKLMDLLKELGLEENTIFVFSSDNGPLGDGHAGTDANFFNSAAGLRGFKGSLYEGGFRVPCIVRWKGRIPAGQELTRVTGFEDWLPTLLELIDNEKAIPEKIDGISFAPSLLGQKQSPRPFLYREFPGYGGQQMVRIGNFTGIRQNLLGKGKVQPNLHIELYDLNADPNQAKDVAAEHPDMIARMDRLMREQHSPSILFPFPALDPKKDDPKKAVFD